MQIQTFLIDKYNPTPYLINLLVAGNINYHFKLPSLSIIRSYPTHSPVNPL